MIISTGKSFKIISLPEFKIKFMGPSFKEEIISLNVFNEIVFVAFPHKLVKLHLFHKLDEIKTEDPILNMRMFSKALVLSFSNYLVVYDSKDLTALNRVNVGFAGMILEHPLTYKNKILVSDRKHVKLVNVNTGKEIFSFNDNPNLHAILSKVLYYHSVI